MLSSGSAGEAALFSNSNKVTELMNLHCLTLPSVNAFAGPSARLDFHHYFGDASRLHKRKCAFEFCEWEPRRTRSASSEIDRITSATGWIARTNAADWPIAIAAVSGSRCSNALAYTGAIS